jgi:hypothetical protein
MSHYRRPYDDGLRLFAWFTFVGGSIFLIFLLIRPVPAVSSMGGGFVVFLVLWFAVGIRGLRGGLLIGEAGVRLRGLVRSRTIAWSDIHDFGGRPEGQRLRLVVVTKDRRVIGTPVTRVRNRLVRSDYVTVRLLPEDYADLVDELRQELRAHQSSTEVGPPT